MPNPLSPESVKLVNECLEVLKKLGVQHDNCPRCEVFDWAVEPVGIPVVSLSGVPAGFGGVNDAGTIALMQFVCKNCGYTMFHNLHAIGLAR